MVDGIFTHFSSVFYSPFSGFYWGRYQGSIRSKGIFEAAMNRDKLVEIKGLKTKFKVDNQWAQAVNGIDLDIYKGETLGIVGESGSGKSVSVLSLIQLIPNPPGEVSECEIYYKGEKIFDGKELDEIKSIPLYRFFDGINENLRKSGGFIFSSLG